MATCGIAPEDDDGNAAARKPALAPLPELKSVTIDDLDEESQAFIKDIAMQIIGFVKEGDEKSAFDLTVKLDNDEKLALWGLLDSKCRSSLKKSAATQQQH
jgi:hypothetical protein